MDVAHEALREVLTGGLQDRVEVEVAVGSEILVRPVGDHAVVEVHLGRKRCLAGFACVIRRPVCPGRLCIPAARRAGGPDIVVHRIAGGSNSLAKHSRRWVCFQRLPITILRYGSV